MFSQMNHSYYGGLVSQKYKEFVVEQVLPGGKAVVSSQGFSQTIEIGDIQAKQGDSLVTTEIAGGHVVVSAMPGSTYSIERFYVDG